LKIDIKICGLNDTAAVAAAVDAGARYAGFVFYPKSPRAVSAEQAASLVTPLPSSVTPVGLFVDASDDEFIRVLRVTPLRMLQLHGSETLQRVASVKTLTGLPVIKAAGIAAVEDVMAAKTYETVADFLLLDAKPGFLPGGNAAAFDWALLKGIAFAKPWLLAGGLTEANVAEAVAVTGARMLDVSSGVEAAPGRKNPAKIRGFIKAVQQIETCY
jgi:phosphoribosylanthranilate isomerase